MNNLLVKDLMWSEPALIAPGATLKEAAAKMAEVDCGVLPVGTDSKIEGIITDRDIVIRAISKGKDPSKERVAAYMTSGVYSCKESDTIRDAAHVMKRNKVGRLAVMSPSNKLSGILSFGHILRNDAGAEEVADIITRVAGKNNGIDSTHTSAS